MFVHNNSKYRSVQPTTVAAAASSTPTTKPPRLLRVEQEEKDTKGCVYYSNSYIITSILYRLPALYHQGVP